MKNANVCIISDTVLLTVVAGAVTFAVTPPPPAGAVTFAVTQPLTVAVTGPAPVQLGLVDADGPVAGLEASVGDTARTVTFRVTPALVDGTHLSNGRGLDVELLPDGSFGSGANAVGCELDCEVELTLMVPVPADQSFWRDTELSGELTVSPKSPKAAVRGAVYPVSIRVEAPFKRYAFYAVAGFALLGTLWGAVAVYGRVTAPLEEPRAGATTVRSCA